MNIMPRIPKKFDYSKARMCGKCFKFTALPDFVTSGNLKFAQLNLKCATPKCDGRIKINGNQND